MQNWVKTISFASLLAYIIPFSAKATCPPPSFFGSLFPPISEQIQQVIRNTSALPSDKKSQILFSWEKSHLPEPGNGYLPGLDASNKGLTCIRLNMDQLTKVLISIASTMIKTIHSLTPGSPLSPEFATLLQVYSILHSWHMESTTPLPALLQRYQEYLLMRTESPLPPNIITQVQGVFTDTLGMSEPDQLRLLAEWEKTRFASPTLPYLPGLTTKNKHVRYLDLDPASRGNVRGNFILGPLYEVDKHVNNSPNLPLPDSIVLMLKIEAVLTVFQRKDPTSREGYGTLDR